MMPAVLRRMDFLRRGRRVAKLVVVWCSMIRQASSLPTTPVVSDFASKTFIKKILETSRHEPQSVLSFFFGADYSKEDQIDTLMRQGQCLESIGDLWYFGGPEYDSLCSSFKDTVRAAGRRELTDERWQGTVDGVASQMILCDQISRNIFRGTDEAFAYDDVAIESSRRLCAQLFEDSPEEVLQGEIYSPYFSVMVLPLMHSESVSDHELAVEVLKYAKRSTPSNLTAFWENQEKFETDHKQVIDRFGRYPHRNKAKGRESTPEELEWLADTDNLPGWASTQ